MVVAAAAVAESSLVLDEVLELLERAWLERPSPQMMFGRVQHGSSRTGVLAAETVAASVSVPEASVEKLVCAVSAAS